jgi:GNAT superfamily N-acetyltransferase
VPGYGLFETADGQHLALSIITENHFWAGLCRVLGLNDVGALGFVDRMARLDELQARIAAAIRTHDRDALVDALLAADAPAAPVLDRHGMLGLAHFRERRVSTSDPWAEAAVGYPVTFAMHPARRVTPPPSVDEHRGATFGSFTLAPVSANDPQVVDLIDREFGRLQARLGEIHDVTALRGIGAFDGDELVGVATEAGDELAALVVAPDRRREGIGGALVDASAGAWLVTTNDNIDAIRLYQRHGYRLAELHVGGVDRARELKPEIPLIGEHGIEIHDELVFRKTLPP